MIYRVGVYALADGSLRTVLNPHGSESSAGQQLCVHAVESERAAGAIVEARRQHRKRACRVAPPRVVLRDRK